MSKLIIDRFENETAVCLDENGNSIDVPKSLLPPDATEGCTIIKNEDHYQVDTEDTKKRKERIEKKMNEVFKD